MMKVNTDNIKMVNEQVQELNIDERIFLYNLLNDEYKKVFEDYKGGADETWCEYELENISSILEKIK